MSTFAVARLHNVNMGEAIVEYLERIDQTLQPYAGRFLVHGGPLETLEGSWSGDLVIIEFETAKAPAPGIGRPRTSQSFRCARKTPGVMSY